MFDQEFEFLNDNDGVHDGTYHAELGNGSNVFSNLPISIPQTASTPSKPRDPLKVLAEDYGDHRIWSVQHWTRTSPDAPASLWPSHVYNGLTYQQAKAKQIELLMGVDERTNSVDIVVRLGV